MIGQAIPLWLKLCIRLRNREESDSNLNLVNVEKRLCISLFQKGCIGWLGFSTVHK